MVSRLILIPSVRSAALILLLDISGLSRTPANVPAVSPSIATSSFATLQVLGANEDNIERALARPLSDPCFCGALVMFSLVSGDEPLDVPCFPLVNGGTD